MKLPQHTGAPPYQLVADVIRRKIRTGQLAPGDKVPSSRELEAKYEIANMTARSSLRLLRQEGLIYSIPGRGNFVADPLPPEAGEPDGQDGRNTEQLASSEYLELSERIDALSEQLEHLARAVERLTPDPSGQHQPE